MNSIFPCSWIAEPNGLNVLPEYLPALEQICILPSIMQNSLIRQIAEQLMKQEPREDFSAFLSIIKTSLFQNQSFVRVPEMDYSGNLFHDIQGLYNFFGWEKKLIHLSLSILFDHHDICLCSLLGLLGRAQRECDARKKMAFSQLLYSVNSYLTSANPGTSNEFSNRSSIPEDIIGIQEVAAAKQRILQFCINKIEEYKSKAFNSTFIEPNILVLTYLRDEVAAGDVDVHGANTTISLLQATTGIAIPRFPLIHDDLKGFCDYLEGNHVQGSLLDELFHPTNIGKSYQVCLNQWKRKQLEMNSASNISVFQSTPSNLRNGQFIFNSQRRCRYSDELAEIAITKSTSPELKTRYLKYLMVFATYFRPENILKVLFNALVQEENGRYLQDMNLVFHFMKHQDVTVPGLGQSVERVIPLDCEDIRFWLWSSPSDGAISDIVFNPLAAQRFFAECNVCKSL